MRLLKKIQVHGMYQPASSNHVNRLIEHFIDIAEQVKFSIRNQDKLGRIKRLFTELV